MKDPFEEQLSRVTFRKPPTHWRKQILDTAIAARGDRRTQKPSIFKIALDFIFKPRPASWATAAAIWALALGLNLLPKEAGENLTLAASQTKPAIKAFAEERQQLASILQETAEPEQPASKPPRRSKPGDQSAAPIFTFA